MASIVALGSCGAEKRGQIDAPPEGATGTLTTQLAPSALGDPSRCRGFSSIEVGVVEPATLDEVRAAHPTAEPAADGEEWVRVRVAGDYEGDSQAWAVYALSFALKNEEGVNSYQMKARNSGLVDGANRIDSYQYYLVSDSGAQLTLVCATADADWALGE